MNNAIIFDMDGVISDTQKFHSQAEIMLLKQFGINISPQEIIEKYAGMSDEEMFAELFHKHHVIIDSMADVIRKKWDLMNELAKGKITAIPNVINLIQNLKKNGFKLGIASASTKVFINDVLTELSIAKYFDALVSTYEVKHGKPAPDIFLLAAKRLGVKPEASIVVEDGRSGMIGAKRAGMKCVGLVKDTTKNYPATKLVSSLGLLSAEELLLL